MARCPGTRLSALGAHTTWQMRRLLITLLTDRASTNSILTGKGKIHIAHVPYHCQWPLHLVYKSDLFIQVLHPAAVDIWLRQCQTGPACGGLLPGSHSATSPLSLRGGEGRRLRTPRETEDHGIAAGRKAWYDLSHFFGALGMFLWELFHCSVQYFVLSCKSYCKVIQTLLWGNGSLHDL